MTLNDRAQEFLKRFLYKKQIKFTLSLLLYSLGLFLGLLPFDNPIHLKIISAVCVIYNIIALLVETKFIKSLNSFTYVKYDILYIFNSIVFLVMPYSSFTIVGLFIIPFSLFFINLAEHSFGLDNLHWPYCFNLVYNCVVLLILILLKESTPLFRNVALNQYSDMFFKSFTLATAAGEISTELVDIRFLFKAKTYKEFILSCFDELTEIPTRRGFSRLYNFDKVKAIAVLDIDDFKKVNDVYGHNVGDIVLKEFATRLRDLTSGTMDLFICRWGGEEFVIFGTSYEIVRFACVELTITMRSEPIIVSEDLQLTKTFSCGMSTKEENDDFEAVFKKADDQCYLAKMNGKNQIYFNGIKLK
ncbi:MAG: GGDEF domain-containing protein [Bacteroidales bacterium]|nr:GGDEF domain-containing protein [Bacteroidales bacterium]